LLDSYNSSLFIFPFEQVKKKAQTIMKTADKDGNGELSIEEFRVVAQKFPNVLFPTFNKPSQE